MEGIQVSVERAGANSNIAVIKVGGYIDTTTSAELEHSLNSLIKTNTYKIIIDLGNVDYISSAGWGIFISEIKGIRERGGDLKLIKMIPDVYEVFELLEFHYIIKAFDTLDEAVNDFEKGGSERISSSSEPITHHQDTKSDYADTSAQQSPSPSAFEAPAQKPGMSSIDDYVTRAATENPTAGIFKLKKLLSNSKYGNVKLGFFELRRKLAQLGLDSKQKRMDYIRPN